MKLKITLLIAMVAAGKLAAATPQASINGNILGQGPTVVSNNVEVSTAPTTVLKNATVYNLVSNALINVSEFSSNIPPVTLPANGFIIFDAMNSDGNVGGLFYVTNRNGFFYPLSGFDTSSNYYSFAEIDTFNLNTNSNIGGMNLGFNNNFNGVQSSRFNTVTGNGSATVTSTALLYVHDNPYAFDAADNLGKFYENNNALLIIGTAVTRLAYATNNLTGWDMTLNGSGNFMRNGQIGVATAKAMFSAGRTNAVSGGGGGGGGGKGPK
ncbi:MAG TPA: hypothetical protein VF988_17385 [Verrucomicrobiae bacterium]